MIPETARFYHPVISVTHDGDQPVEFCSGFALRMSEWQGRGGGTGEFQKNGMFSSASVKKFITALENIRKVRKDIDVFIDCENGNGSRIQERVSKVRDYFTARGLEEEEPIRLETNAV